MKNQKVSVSFIDDIKQNSDIKILDIIERQKKGGLCFVGSESACSLE
jgi:hypothetical protein